MPIAGILKSVSTYSQGLVGIGKVGKISDKKEWM
jgi:hypothetical protein